jgi:PAS domain S-box-containing protein
MALCDNSRDFIGLATADGARILYVNRAGRELLGLPEVEELSGRGVLDLPVDRGLLSGTVLDSISKQGYWQGEADFQNFKTGELIPMDLNTFLVSDSKTGQAIAWASVARDVRERKANEARLRSFTAELLKAQEDERRRVARELHDGPTQDLALLAAELGLLRKKGITHEEDLEALRARVLSISEDVRSLAHQFHPSVLEHSGLVAALEAYCQEVSRSGGIPVRFRAGKELESVSIPGPVSTTLYRIVQEALRNVHKHSNATTATVTLAALAQTPGQRVLRLTIMDDGKGFLIEQVRNGSGLGLISIEERARMVQGVFRIGSLPGEGTRVEVEVPIPEVQP